MEVPEDLRDLFEKKLRKFNKFFRDDTIAYIKLSKKRNMEVLELTISSSGILYRSEKESTTFNNALDEVIEAIERQIRKNKTRLEKRLREGAFIKDSGDSALLSVEEEPEFNIRVKSFAIKPMTPEEAILQMNLLGHTFFMFKNAESGEINVVYKRYDDDYGMIVPM